MKTLQFLEAAAILGILASAGRAEPPPLQLPPVANAILKCAPPMGTRIELSKYSDIKAGLGQLELRAAGETAAAPARSLTAQFLPDTPKSSEGILWWLASETTEGRWTLSASSQQPEERMRAVHYPATGRWHLTETGALVLAYNYQTNDPGNRLASIHPDYLKYAKARSDYIHPLMGLDGEEMTLDWPVDHPHHRGIYWAWPEVECGEGRGDLHALQRVFARPTGRCSGQGGPLFAQVSAENIWWWEDRKPLVREQASLRIWRANEAGRWVDLEFQFTALEDGVTVARRETKLYGGLNVRLSAVKDQQIICHTDPAGTTPRIAWADLNGLFPGGRRPTGLAIFQHPTNPDYPGEWVKFEGLNWLQPTFPESGTRYALKKDRPLTLKYRLWIHAGQVEETEMAQLGSAYANSLPVKPH
jgi:hypothetical protein